MDLKYAYCNECEDLVEFKVYDEIVTERYKGEEVEFEFAVGRCKYCNTEVATDIDYNTRKSEKKYMHTKKRRELLI